MDDLRRFVQIDDTKRALYMEARRTLKEGFSRYGSAFVCLELKDAVFSIVPTINTFGATAKKKAESMYKWNQIFFDRVISNFEEMFPELIELFDGYTYLPHDRIPTQVWEAWFAAEMLEARIALIDFILSHS